MQRLINVAEKLKQPGLGPVLGLRVESRLGRRKMRKMHKVQFTENIFHGHHQLGPILNQLVGANTGLAEDASRNRKGVASLLASKTGGDEGATLPRCLRHYDSQG